MPVNEKQLAAIMTRVPNVLVSAGAGSGKTSVLTQRYFHLLDDVVDGRKVRVDDILTLTFTRKAAQEMRERIAAKFEQEGRMYERRELGRAPIGTIHSFCESVLREYALHAGIDPNFRLLDEAESGTLQENALDAVFENLWNQPQQQREAIGRLLLDVPQRQLRDGLLKIFRTARTRGVAITDLAPLPALPLETAAKTLSTAVDDLLALSGTAKWQEKQREVAQASAELHPSLTDATEFSWDTYRAVESFTKRLTPAGGPASTAKAARDAIHAAMGGWLEAYLDLAARPYLAAFLTLQTQFAQAYRQAKDAQGLLDFEDLLLITRDLLQDEESGIVARLRQRFYQVMVDEFQDTNPLQFSIIRALQHEGNLFMVGDVKQAIYRFIGSDIRVFLRQEQRILELGESGERIAMHVNYRTRPEVLEPLNGIFSRLWPLDAFDDGFTFEPLSAGREFIPKDVPSVELALWPQEKGDIAADLRDREARWISRRILQLTGAYGDALPVTDKSADGEPLLARPARFGDVLLLFRASTHIALYEDALRSAGIPFYVVSGRGFYHTREVQDLLYLLRALENPMDDFSVTVVLRSPLVAVSDDTLYWLSRDWSQWSPGDPFPAEKRSAPQYGRLWENIARIEQLPFADAATRDALIQFRTLIADLQVELAAGQPLDLIDLVLARTKYATVLLAMEGGDQRYANMQKLREVAATFQGRGIFDLTDFQRYLTQLSGQAPREASAPLDVEGSNVVRLMTIHAAKGLEAPIVFLADGGHESQTVRDTFLFTPDGIACQVPTPEDEWARPATYHQAATQLAREDRREIERLLYVALTRAREQLICCGFTKFPAAEKRTTYADLLAGVLGLAAPVDADTDIPITFEDTAYPARVWSPASLCATENLETPPQPSTLWERFSEKILAGGELPVPTDSADILTFEQVNAHLQPLPHVRREGPLRVGVHRALCYRACPRQYWLRYVLHDDGRMTPSTTEEHEPTLVEDDEQERMDGTEFGKLFHAVMSLMEFSRPLLDQLDAILGALDSTPTPGDRAHLESCLATLMRMPVYPHLCRATALQRELRFLAREGAVFVPGIIDLLAQVDGAWWIIDYKTGGPSANHMRQVMLYALGVEATLGVRPTRVILTYIDRSSPGNYRDDAVTDELIADVRRLVHDVGDGIRTEQFAPKNGRHCEQCPFRYACPEGDLTVV